MTPEGARRHCPATHLEVVRGLAKAMAELSILAFNNSHRDLAYLMQGILVDGMHLSEYQASDLLHQAAVDLEFE